MTEEKKIIEFDGHLYEEGQPIPDIGRWVHVGDPDAKRRDYMGYVADKDLLPKYDDLETGSTAQALDADYYAIYHSITREWEEQE